MATDLESQQEQHRESVRLAEELCEQIADFEIDQSSGNVSLSQETLDSILTTLQRLTSLPSDDLSDEHSQGTASDGQLAQSGTGALADIQAAILEQIDGSFARWQSQVELALGEGVNAQLVKQISDLRTAQESLADLALNLQGQLDRRATELSERENCLEEKTQETETRLAAVLQREAATFRQRRELSERFRRQLAEAKLEIASERASLAERQVDNSAESNRLELELAEVKARLASSNEQLAASKTKLIDLENQKRRDSESLSKLEADLETQNAASSEHAASTDQLQSQLDEITSQRDEANDRAETADQRAESAEQNAEQLESEIAQLREQLESAAADDGQNEQLNQEIEKLQNEIQSLKDQLSERSDQLEQEADAENARLLETITKLTTELEETQQRCETTDTLAQQLVAAEQEIEQLKLSAGGATGDESHAEELNKAREDLEAAEERIAQLEKQAEELASATEQGDQEDSDGPASKLLSEQAETISELRDELAEALEQIATLRQSQVSSGEGGNSNNFANASLSWEERKQLIMQQLEHDDGDGGEVDESTRLEIDQILESTQAEIDRRDREIEELQSIVQQQSDTKQGVAIGAAAIGQMFDEDSLIVEEREKLKTIQSEWEEKVRQAEIDISMERAKLARQRTEVETKVAELEAQLKRHGGNLAPPESSEETGGNRTRKWLEHLGLRDEK